MVLEELGGRISNALRSLSSNNQIDKATFDACLKEISNALITSDVEISLVMKVRKNIEAKVKLADLAAGIDKRAVIERAVRDELCSLLDGSGGDTVNKPKRGRPYVVMFVGLQGNGKTTTCMKYAYHYKRKGFKPAMVCADTFRAGAYDQLKQNATRAGVPFYGSYDTTDPAEIAEAGVAVFKASKRDVVIVDTSGRHAQSDALFEEMREIAARIEPDMIVFVMDATTGQSAGDQARAFRDSVKVGGVIITKMDGSAKGGSTLSAVAATGSPVLFLGTGEHMDALEEFETKAFVSRLLGKGDIKGLTKKLEEVMPEEKQQEFMEQVQKGNMTMRFFRNFLEQVGSMGPLSSIMGMMPMFSNMNLGNHADKETQIKFRRYMTIMDSMTERELDESDSRKLMEPSRIKRFAYGSGRSVIEVMEMMQHYRMMTKSAGKLSQATKRMDPRNMQASMAQMQNALPPQLMRQLQQHGGMSELLKGMQGMPGMGGMKF